jgi:hypothetical protein
MFVRCYGAYFFWGGTGGGWWVVRATAADLHVEGSCDPCPWAERHGGCGNGGGNWPRAGLMWSYYSSPGRGLGIMKFELLISIPFHPLSS